MEELQKQHNTIKTLNEEVLQKFSLIKADGDQKVINTVQKQLQAVQKQSQHFFLECHKLDFQQLGNEIQNLDQKSLSFFGCTAQVCLSIDIKISENKEDYKLVGLGGKGGLNFFYFIQKNEKPIYNDMQSQDQCQRRDLEIATVKFSFSKNILYFGKQTGEIGFVNYKFDDQGVMQTTVRDPEPKYFQEKITQIQIYYQNNSESKKDYLLISSFEGKIILFQFEEKKQQNETFEYILSKQQVLEGHNEAVFWLVLSDTKIDNKPQVFLASSGKDPNILIWKLENNKWSIYTKYLKSQYGNRIAFFDQGEIIWQLFRKPVVRVMKMDQKKVVQLQELLIKDYSDTDYKLETDQFPLIYNERRGIIVLKSKDKIYIIKRSLGKQGVIQLIQTQIKCGFDCNIAAVSQDGNVLYTVQNKNEIHRYKLNLYD